MSTVDPWSFGSNIRHARLTAGWTQAELGRRCGYSAAQVSRWESNKQPLRDVELLRRLADVLNLPADVFGLAAADTPAPTAPPAKQGPRVSRTVPTSAEEADPVRRRAFILATGLAVLGSGASSPTADADPAKLLSDRLGNVLVDGGAGAAPAAADALQRALSIASSDFTACRYVDLAQELPPLVAAADATAESTGDTAALRLVAQSYNLATRALIKGAVSGLEWVSADRALRAAWGAEDALVLAEAQRLKASVARRAGQHDRAQSMTLAAAQHLQASARPGPAHLAMVGTLYLSAGYAAARAEDRDRARELLDEADRVAAQLRDDPERHQALVANVVSHRLSVGVLLGDAGTALAHADRFPLRAVPTVERRARMLVDQAMAWEQWGKPERAYKTLLAAERAAPGEVHTRNAVRRLVNELRRAPAQSTMPGLPALAKRVHLNI